MGIKETWSPRLKVKVSEVIMLFTLCLPIKASELHRSIHCQSQHIWLIGSDSILSSRKFYRIISNSEYLKFNLTCLKQFTGAI
jgi:hypothetical protein